MYSCADFPVSFFTRSPKYFGDRLSWAAQYETEGNPYHSTARLWDDGVIDPVDTRQILGLALSVVLNSPVGENHFGVFRM